MNSPYNQLNLEVLLVAGECTWAHQESQPSDILVECLGRIEILQALKQYENPEEQIRQTVLLLAYSARKNLLEASGCFDTKQC